MMKKYIISFILAFCAISMQAANTPTVVTICRDLIGHNLSEGVKEGYYPREWHWTIEEGEISNFRILSVRENTEDRYTIDVQMKLSTSTRAFIANATIYYVHTPRGWDLEMVKSRGMNIVRTYRYDDCIQPEYGDGYLNKEDLYLVNDCEVTLEVGGKIFKYGSWRKFSTTVSPHSTQQVDYYVEEYVIDYVERP